MEFLLYRPLISPSEGITSDMSWYDENVWTILVPLRIGLVMDDAGIIVTRPVAERYSTSHR